MNKEDEEKLNLFIQENPNIQITEKNCVHEEVSQHLFKLKEKIDITCNYEFDGIVILFTIKILVLFFGKKYVLNCYFKLEHEMQPSNMDFIYNTFEIESRFLNPKPVSKNEYHINKLSSNLQKFIDYMTIIQNRALKNEGMPKSYILK